MSEDSKGLEELRDALENLYDPVRLRRSPLVRAFQLDQEPDPAAALRRLLTEAIESLRPSPQVPPQARAWRIYDLLLYRYVQQFSQQEVADQLGLSVRHLRREQAEALNELAQAIQRLRNASSPVGVNEPDTIASGCEELAWVDASPGEPPVAIEDVLRAVLSLTEPVARRYATRIEARLSPELPDLSVPQVPLRQILLNLLTVAIHRADHSPITVDVTRRGWEVDLTISAESERVDPVARDDLANLRIAEQLAQLCGGRLTSVPDGPMFFARLSLPAVETLPVLAVDDHEDTLQLLKRFTTGTRYRLLTLQDPSLIKPTIAQHEPQILILDVMMPRIDGWEVLGDLRQDPLTAGLPIVVCTILAQEELALSLGANAFIRKPFTRQTLLSTLDRLVTSMAIAPD